MKRKILAFALALVMALSLMPVGVFAEDPDITITMESTTLKYDSSDTKEITLKITADKLPEGGVTAAQFSLDYNEQTAKAFDIRLSGQYTNNDGDDVAYLQKANVEVSEGNFAATRTGSGDISLRTNGSNANMVALVTLTPKADIESGTYMIGFKGKGGDSDYLFFRNNDAKYDVTWTPAAITVTGATPTLDSVGLYSDAQYKTASTGAVTVDAESDVTLYAQALSKLGHDVKSGATWSVVDVQGVEVDSSKGVSVSGGTITISKTAEKGTYYIKATPDGTNAKGDAKQVAVTVSRAASVAKSMTLKRGTTGVGTNTVAGTDTLTIPTTGSTAFTYTVEAVDQFGGTIASPSVTWTFDTADANVTQNGGVVTVTKDAVASSASGGATYTLKAKVNNAEASTVISLVALEFSGITAVLSADDLTYGTKKFSELVVTTSATASLNSVNATDSTWVTTITKDGSTVYDSSATTGNTGDSYPGAGTYTYTVTWSGKISDVDYTNVTAQTGTLTIKPKDVTITMTDATKAYGAELTAATNYGKWTIDTGSAYGGNDTAESNDIQVTASTTASKDSNVGGYNITGTASSANYNVTAVNNGKLTITAIDYPNETNPLTVSATVPATLAKTNNTLTLSQLDLVATTGTATIKSVAIGTNTDGLLTGTPTIDETAKTTITYATTSVEANKTGHLTVVVTTQNYGEVTVDVTVTAKAVTVADTTWTSAMASAKSTPVYGDTNAAIANLTSGATFPAKAGGSENNNVVGTIAVKDGSTIQNAGSTMVTLVYTVTGAATGVTEDVSAYTGVTIEQAYTITAIAKKELTAVWTGTSLTYNGTAQKPAATAETGVTGETATLTVTGEQTDADTYTATATITSVSGGNASADNYTLSTASGSQSFTIAPKSISGVDIATINAQDYTGTEKTLSLTVTDSAIKDGVSDKTLTEVSGTIGDYAISYAVSDTPGRLGDNDKPLGAGSYTVTITGAGNYTGTKTASFTIKPVNPTSITWQLDSLGANVVTTAYDGNEHTMTATVTGVNSETITALTYDGTQKATDSSADLEGAKYTVSIKALGNTDYTLTTADNTTMTSASQAWTIAKATAPSEGTVKLEKSIYYKDTTAQTINPSDFTGWLQNAGPGTVTFKASSTPATVTGEAASAISTNNFTNNSFQLVALQNADLVGKTATWTVQLDSDNYETTTATVTVTLINKTPVTFAVNGEENPSTLTAEYTGSAFALTTSLKDYTPPTGASIKAEWYKESAKLDAAPKDAGTYKLVLSYEDDVENNNGVPGYVGKLEIPVTITPKEVTVSGITAQDKTYDNTTDATLVYDGLTITGKVGSDGLSATATGAFENANAGSGKTVTISSITLTGEDKDNYTLADSGNQASTTAKIDKATRTLSVSNPTGDAGLTLYGEGTSGSITLAVDKDLDSSAAAAITCAPSVAGIVSLTNNELVYTAAYAKTGRTTLTFTLPVTTNYEAGGSVSVTVVVKDGYTVTIADNIEGGTVKTDKATAKSGETVTLTVTANTGYAFSSLTVTNTDSSGAVTANSSSEGKHTFTMPAGNVTVSATFTQNTYTITNDSTGGVTYNVTVGGKNASSAHYGDEVTVTAVSSENGKAVSEFTYTSGTGSDAKTTTVTADATGAYKFKMPASNITIKATVDTLYDVTAATELTEGSVSVTPAKAAKGATIVVTPTASDGHTVGAVTYKYTEGTTETEKSVTVAVDNEGKPVYSFVMPNAAVTVSAEFISTNAVTQAAGSLTAAGGAAGGETEATIEVNVTTETATALKTAAEAVTVSTSDLASAIATTTGVDAMSNEKAGLEADEAIAALTQAGLVEVDANGDTPTVKTTGASSTAVTTVRVVNKVYMDVIVIGYDEAASDSFKLEIKPMTQKVATIADGDTELTDGNSVPMGAAKELKVNASVQLTIGIPDAMYNKAANVGGNKTVYIKHVHGGKTYEYPATVSGSAGSYKATFKNPHGFSEFMVTLESSTVASFEAGAGDIRYYPSFKECVADAIAAEKYEITMYKMPTGSDKAQIAKAVTLTIAKSGGASVDFDELYATWITIADSASGKVSKASTDAQINAGTFVYSTTYTVTVSGATSVQAGSTITLTATVTGADGSTVSSPTLTWTSSDPSVATVNNGVVTGVKAGSADITAKYTNLGNDYISAAHSVTVTSGGGSNGGGGGGATATVTKTTSANGSYTLSSTTARAGTKVTITAKPDSGYEVDAVTVKDKSGNTLSVTKNADGTYSFTMPTANLQPVSTSVTFKPIATPATPGFTDVPAGSYYADAVAWAVANEVTYGTDDTHFSPDADCTRAQFVTFLWRAAGSPEPADGNPFNDVSESGQSAYYKAILWAAEQGITQGTNAEGTEFDPNATINRAQAVTFLSRYAKGSGSGANAFDDVPAGEYYSEAVDWAVTNGITVGNSTEANTFGPLDSCIRAQMITFLYRLFAD